jgi:hypothetical protein
MGREPKKPLSVLVPRHLILFWPSLHPGLSDRRGECAEVGKQKRLRCERRADCRFQRAFGCLPARASDTANGPAQYEKNSGGCRDRLQRDQLVREHSQSKANFGFVTTLWSEPQTEATERPGGKLPRRSVAGSFVAFHRLPRICFLLHSGRPFCGIRCRSSCRHKPDWFRSLRLRGSRWSYRVRHHPVRHHGVYRRRHEIVIANCN